MVFKYFYTRTFVIIVQISKVLQLKKKNFFKLDTFQVYINIHFSFIICHHFPLKHKSQLYVYYYFTFPEVLIVHFIVFISQLKVLHLFINYKYISSYVSEHCFNYLLNPSLLGSESQLFITIFCLLILFSLMKSTFLRDSECCCMSLRRTDSFWSLFIQQEHN